jgi:2-methylcitrate dehydratase PrpD
MTLADSGPVPLRDPATLDLADKIHIHADPACRTPAIIGRTEMTIRNHAGEQMTRSDDCPLGAPSNPVPAAMLRAKLSDCVAHCGRDIALGDLDDFIEQVENIEYTPLARALFDLFA